MKVLIMTDNGEVIETIPKSEMGNLDKIMARGAFQNRVRAAIQKAGEKELGKPELLYYAVVRTTICISSKVELTETQVIIAAKQLAGEGEVDGGVWAEDGTEFAGKWKAYEGKKMRIKDTYADLEWRGFVGVLTLGDYPDECYVWGFGGISEDDIEPYEELP